MRTFKKNAAKAILGTLAAAAALVTTAGTANAHATLQLYGSTPTAGGYGHMFLRVPHGCDGAATDTIKVQIPAGFTSVKPQAKAGWNVSTVKADGKNVSEVIWSGGSLADSNFDDFGLSVKYPATAGTYYAPTVQLCGTASAAWTQIPAAGQDSHSLDHPAPSVKVVAGGHGHGGTTASPWTGDVEVNIAHKKATVTVDASSIHRGKIATIKVTGTTRTATVKKVKLDKAGDAHFVVNAVKRGIGAYTIKDGFTVEVVVGGKTIATAKVGGAGSNSHG
jgi:uncharacterized protein YcnI